jgi:hypothetical protein
MAKLYCYELGYKKGTKLSDWQGCRLGGGLVVAVVTMATILFFIVDCGGRAHGVLRLSILRRNLQYRSAHSIFGWIPIYKHAPF